MFRARGESVLERRRGRGRSPTAAAGFKPTSLYPKKILVIMAMALFVITPSLLAPTAIPPSRRRLALVLARRLQLPRAFCRHQPYFGINFQTPSKTFHGPISPARPHPSPRCAAIWNRAKCPDKHVTHTNKEELAAKAKGASGAHSNAGDGARNEM